jgi:hypothetical protein
MRKRSGQPNEFGIFVPGDSKPAAAPAPAPAPAPQPVEEEVEVSEVSEPAAEEEPKFGKRSKRGK